MVKPTKTNSIVAKKQPQDKPASDENDPIGQSLAARKESTDFNAPLTDAIIKKTGVQIFKAPKL